MPKIVFILALVIVAQAAHADTVYGNPATAGFDLSDMKDTKHLTGPPISAAFKNKLAIILKNEAETIAMQARQFDISNADQTETAASQSIDETTRVVVIKKTDVSDAAVAQSTSDANYELTQRQAIQNQFFLLPQNPGETNLIKDLGMSFLSSAAMVTANSVTRNYGPAGPTTQQTIDARSAVGGTFRTTSNDRVQVGCSVNMSESALCLIRVRLGRLKNRVNEAPVYEGLSRGIR